MVKFETKVPKEPFFAQETRTNKLSQMVPLTVEL